MTSTNPPTGSVVVVDDFRTVRLLYQAILESRGHRVETAKTVDEALAACARVNPDVVVVDMFLGQSFGTDLILTLRKRGPRPRVIAVSGGEPGEDFGILALAKDVGADLTLQKPVSADALLDAVEQLLLAP